MEPNWAKTITKMHRTMEDILASLGETRLRKSLLATRNNMEQKALFLQTKNITDQTYQELIEVAFPNQDFLSMQPEPAIPQATPTLDNPDPSNSTDNATPEMSDEVTFLHSIKREHPIPIISKSRTGFKPQPRRKAGRTRSVHQKLQQAIKMQQILKPDDKPSWQEELTLALQIIDDDKNLSRSEKNTMRTETINNMNLDAFSDEQSIWREQRQKLRSRWMVTIKKHERNLTKLKIAITAIQTEMRQLHEEVSQDENMILP